MRLQSDSVGRDAQLLLGEALGQPRAWVLSHPEVEMTGDQLAEFVSSVERVADGAALPHVLGWWEFYGRRFHIEPEVLIPRPETELIVEQALDKSPQPSRILDLGTGCGCIAVTLAIELPATQIWASDLSWSALQIARRNVEAYHVARSVRLINANLVQPFEGVFDLICANLPYIATDQLPSLAVANREPKIALDGGVDGLELINASLDRLPDLLAPGGSALFEIDPAQVEQLATKIEGSFPRASWQVLKDLSGKDRLLVVERH